MSEIEHEDEDDGEVPRLEPMPRRQRPDDEADGEARRDRGEERTRDGLTPRGRRTTGRQRRLERRRRPRNRHDPSGPPR